MVPEVDSDDHEALLTPAEVATLFRVTPKTVTRWAEAGKLPVVKTLGGHRRFPARHVHRVRAEMNGTTDMAGTDSNGTTDVNGANDT